MSMIEELVAQKILKRGDKGLEKYGVSMADEQLPLLGWLNHLQEELMDASVYIEKIMLEEELKLLDNGDTNNETI
jgi:hypothetical protein